MHIAYVHKCLLHTKHFFFYPTEPVLLVLLNMWVIAIKKLTPVNCQCLGYNYVGKDSEVTSGLSGRVPWLIRDVCHWHGDGEWKCLFKSHIGLMASGLWPHTHLHGGKFYSLWGCDIIFFQYLSERIKLFHLHFFVVVQSLSRVQLSVTPWTAAHQASLSFTISQKFAQPHVHWVGDAIQPSHPLSSPSPLAFSLSRHQRLF